MWTRQTRGRMAAIERKTKRYPSDLTDEEWDRIAPLLPKPSRRGRKPSVAMREVSERDPLHDALGRRMAHAAEGLPALADGLLVVPALCAVDAVPDHPRHRLDDGPGAYGPGSQPECRHHRQPDGKGAGAGRAAGLRCRQEDGRPQAAHRGRYRRTAVRSEERRVGKECR